MVGYFQMVLMAHLKAIDILMYIWAQLRYVHKFKVVRWFLSMCRLKSDQTFSCFGGEIIFLAQCLADIKTLDISA